MAARRSLDEKLAALREIRGQQLTPDQVSELRKRIGDRSNLVVAAAAAIAGENGLVELSGALEAAFDRFLVNPLKDDKLCRAKIAIIEALDLRRPIYRATAAYGHFGRELPEFTWERTDRADALASAV